MIDSSNKPSILWQSEFFLVLQNNNTRAGDQRASFESMKQWDRLCNLSNLMHIGASCQRKIGSTWSAYGTRFATYRGSIPELTLNRADMDLVSKLLPTHQGRMCVSLKVRYGAGGKAVYKSGKVTYNNLLSQVTAEVIMVINEFVKQSDCPRHCDSV